MLTDVTCYTAAFHRHFHMANYLIQLILTAKQIYNAPILQNNPDVIYDRTIVDVVSLIKHYLLLV